MCVSCIAQDDAGAGGDGVGERGAVAVDQCEGLECCGLADVGGDADGTCTACVQAQGLGVGGGGVDGAVDVHSAAGGVEDDVSGESQCGVGITQCHGGVGGAHGAGQGDGAWCGGD